MPCHFFPGGVVCTRGRRKACSTPGHASRPAVASCDWKLHRMVDGKPEFTGKTCDAGICAGCRKPPAGTHRDGRYKGQPIDLCPPHHAEAERRGLLAAAAAREAKRAEPPAQASLDLGDQVAPSEPLTIPEGVPLPHELWREAGGDRDRYVALMVKHGHLIPRPTVH